MSKEIIPAKQFYGKYKEYEKLPPLWTEISSLQSKQIKNLNGSNIYKNNMVNKSSTPSGSYIFLCLTILQTC